MHCRAYLELADNVKQKHLQKNICNKKQALKFYTKMHIFYILHFYALYCILVYI